MAKVEEKFENLNEDQSSSSEEESEKQKFNSKINIE